MFKDIFKVSVFLGCLSFVLWQCHQAFEKFGQKPRSTSMGIDYSKNWALPKIVFCPAIKTGILESCGLTEYDFKSIFKVLYWFSNFSDHFMSTMGNGLEREIWTVLTPKNSLKMSFKNPLNSFTQSGSKPLVLRNSSSPSQMILLIHYGILWILCMIP